ncbi:A kinase (PRKA) anchor protein 1b [Syngnathus acus]|uniref:A kinase (PRKA) anchor protein 1b n=1 Tax=Syngnathus acus TaxID=161584 RepID=UPI001885FC82|nr:A kinase (PRKA) anchor protein 1b [Syngnathus acus]XP_037124305.1 A kinase (PRKA) anchor protein 1b [Syngnathus acus]XP_037124306.1 A kinase (PRKA) anchor protein 1b [Syngnathus acus]
MPLRFRSIVPYTVPGVLALIGWWWYTSRKKERLISHDAPDDGPTNASLRLCLTTGTGPNGVVEKDTVSTPHNTKHHLTCRDPKASINDEEQENMFQNHVDDTDTASNMGQTLKETAVETCGIQVEVQKPTGSTLLPYEQDESFNVSVKDHGDLKKSPIPSCGSEANLDLKRKSTSASEITIKDMVLSCQATNITPSTTTTSGCLADAERPEPEGEVAQSHTTMTAQDDGCAIIPIEAQRVVSSQFESRDKHISQQDLNQHILTSTPNSLVLTPKAQTTSLTSQEIQVPSHHGEEQDLEVLAAGLITEVISAATQQVFGGINCQVSDSSQQCHHPRLSTHHQTGCEETQNKEQVMPNGSFTDSWESLEVNELVQTNYTQKEPMPKLSHQIADSIPLLNNVVKDNESATQTEDSACSTCHSEDGISNENHQHSLMDSKMDVFQITDLSEKEVTQTQSLIETPADGIIFPLAEENSVDAVCGVKMLDGIDVRNGPQGCEVETDQSGGSDVNSMDSVDSGCTMGARESYSTHASSSSSELVIWEIEVPKLLVGRLIGKQGRYVGFLKQTSGAKIYISTLPYTQEFQICHIEGMQQQVDKALSLIGKKFKDLDLTNLYAPPPPPLTLPSLPMTSWLLLPSGVTVEVIVVNIVSAGHVFVQQHTHPTYHALRSLDQQMFLCYSQPGTPTLPSPAEVGVICAAPAVEGAWWRAQVITFYKESNEVEIRYVDYGGYDRVKIDSLRQIRSDFVTLPFQGAEVLLDNVAPLPGEDRFSSGATSALEEMTRGVALLAQVSNYDNSTGLPLVHLWNMVGEDVISINRTLAERGLGVWVDGF